MSRVRKEEVLNIGEKLQYILRAHAINLEEAGSLLFENLEESTLLKDMSDMLLE